MYEWIEEVQEKLNEQIEALDAERESALGAGKKTKVKVSKDRTEKVSKLAERHKWHIEQLSNVINALQHDKVTVAQVIAIKDDVEVYVDQCQEPDFFEDEFLYDNLGDIVPDESEVSELSDASGLSDDDSKEDKPTIDSEADDVEEKKTSAPAKILPKVPAPVPVIAKKPIQSAIPNPVPATFLASTPTNASQSTAATPVSLHVPNPTVSNAIVSAPASASLAPTITLNLAHRAVSAPTAAQTAVPIPVVSAPTPVISSVPGSAVKPPSMAALLKKKESNPDSVSVTAPAPPPAIVAPSPEVIQQQMLLMQAKTILTANQAPANPVVSSTPSNVIHPTISTNSSAAAPTLIQSSATLSQPVLQSVASSTVQPPVSQISPLIAPPVPVEQTPWTLLESSIAFRPTAVDSERSKVYAPRNPYLTPSFFPTVPANSGHSAALVEKMNLDTLFFIFYFSQGSAQTQPIYYAAKELKKLAWRYHKNYLTWFQRHEDGKCTITPQGEKGPYLYFDYEQGWCQRIKQDFVFDYKFLEDEPF